MIENLPGEIWKDIPGFEKYRVSNMGRVGSLLKRTGGIRGANWKCADAIQRILLPRTNYNRIFLRANGQTLPHFIHRLVMLVFVGECPAGMIVCHKDGNKQNNVLENLRYDTKHNSLVMQYSNDVMPQSSISRKDVIEIRKMVSEGVSYRNISKHLGIPWRTVQSATSGITHSYITDPPPITAMMVKDRRNKKIRHDRKQGMELLQLAAKYDLTKSAISLICSGKRG